MAVRIRLKIKSAESDKETEARALVNSGYESERPEVLIPARVAQQIGFWPDMPKSITIERYENATGKEEKLINVRDAVKVAVLIKDRTVKPVMSDLVILEGEGEVIINDKLSSKFGIVLLDIGKGLWCFEDEINKKTREG